MCCMFDITREDHGILVLGALWYYLNFLGNNNFK